MGKIFNIAGPCNPERHYMLPATERVPEVMRLVKDEAYFVVHAQRQCGKTTAFRALVDDINTKGERLAMYCSLEVVQEFPAPTDGIPMIYEKIRGEAQYRPELKACPFLTEGHRRFDRETLASKGISDVCRTFRLCRQTVCRLLRRSGLPVRRNARHVPPTAA